MFKATVLIAVILVACPAVARADGGSEGMHKLDRALRARADVPAGTSRVIIQASGAGALTSVLRGLGAQPGPALPLVHAQLALVPDHSLAALARSPLVARVSLDRPVHGTLERTPLAIGAVWARQHFDVDGSGIGVAIIDSGVTAWHDDLGVDRVVHFRDFVSNRPTAYDDYGHGTHVAGIIAGSGYDSGGDRRGVAPGARLIVLKALDGSGDGYISHVIAALSYAIEHREQFNIRIINLSVASGVYESFTTDPLTLAAKRAVDAGIVVVTAAGNFGKGADGQPLYGGITSPGNAPWVLTVGAGSHNGTTRRRDDTVAPFSSRGPTQIDRAVKPDLVAPGVAIESLADADSVLFGAHPTARLWGTVETVTEPYLSLSGTSMAAPVVAGTIALMLEANPRLTPNLIKAILQYTAERRSIYDHFTEGAGALNARGAVQLARELAGEPRMLTPADPTRWSRQILWGSLRITGGVLRAGANAWRLGVTWGDERALDGQPIAWGTSRNEFADEIPWGPRCAAGGDNRCEPISWAASTEVPVPAWGDVRSPQPCSGRDTSCETGPTPPRGWRWPMAVPKADR